MSSQFQSQRPEASPSIVQASFESPLKSPLQSWMPLLLSQLEAHPINAISNRHLGFFLRETAAFFLGIATLVLLARISITLPFTPVPITGQTFGVASIALLWGRNRGAAIVLSYLIFGAIGLPFFAAGASGFLLGPTSGYLIGMLLSSLLVGSLADRGWSQSFQKAWLAATLGSVLVFFCGLMVLSRFVPKEALLISGFYPFIIGDGLKNILAAIMASNITQKLKPNQTLS